MVSTRSAATMRGAPSGWMSVDRVASGASGYLGRLSAPETLCSARPATAPSTAARGRRPRRRPEPGRRTAPAGRPAPRGPGAQAARRAGARRAVPRCHRPRPRRRRAARHAPDSPSGAGPVGGQRRAPGPRGPPTSRATSSPCGSTPRTTTSLATAVRLRQRGAELAPRVGQVGRSGARSPASGPGVVGEPAARLHPLGPEPARLDDLEGARLVVRQAQQRHGRHLDVEVTQRAAVGTRRSPTRS